MSRLEHAVSEALLYLGKLPSNSPSHDHYLALQSALSFHKRNKAPDNYSEIIKLIKRGPDKPNPASSINVAECNQRFIDELRGMVGGV